ncbi:MAG: hypothetical protein ACUVTY_00535 [Armatimonadota bacterium]
MRWLTISANLTIRELVDTFGAQLGNDVQILLVFHARGYSFTLGSCRCLKICLGF